MEYFDENYYFYDFPGGGYGCTINANSELIKAEKSENEIYIYDKFLYTEDKFEKDEKNMEAIMILQK